MADDPDTSLVKEDPAIDSLDERIARARDAEAKRTGHDDKLMGEARSGAMTVASTMVGYPLGGIIVGWLLDQAFDTLPWLTITMMFLAFIGACIHVVRMNSNKSGD